MPRWIWEYTAISQLHGFSFIDDAKDRWVRAIAWFCLFLAAFCYSLHDLIVLIQTYQQQQTGITIDTTQIFSTYLFPSASVCVEIDFWQYISQNLGSISESEFNSTLLSLSSNGQLAVLQNQNISGLETQIFGGLSSPIFYGQQSLDPTIVTAAYSVLTLAMDYDRGQSGSAIKLHSSYSNESRLIDIMQAYIDENQIDYRFLAKVIGTYLCRQMKIQTSSSFSGIVFECYTLDSIVWMGAPGFLNRKHILCIDLPNRTIFSDTSINAELLVYGFIDTIYTNNSLSGSYSFAADLNLVFDPRGGKSSRDSVYLEALAVAPFWSSISGGIEATSQWIWLNRTDQPCDANTEQFECAEQNFFDQIEKTRECGSLADFGQSFSTIKSCTRRYTAIEADQSNAQFGFENWNMIYNKCPRKCDQTYMRFTISPTGAVGVGTTQLTVGPKPILYSIFSEYYLLDFQALLYAFGGSIGWWIGGSLLAFVHIIVFATKVFVRWLVAKLRKSQVESEPTSCGFCNGKLLKIFDNSILKFVHEFSFITDFHGFPYLAKEDNLFAAIIWIALIPIFIWLTIRDTILLVNQYESVPVSISFTVQQNATLSFDDVSVCVQFDQYEQFESLASSAPQFSGISSVASFNETLITFIASGQMDFLRNIPNVVTAQNLSTLDISVMTVSQVMISAFTDYDNENFATVTTFGVNMSFIFQFVDMFKNVLLLNNVDFFQLAKLVGAFQCENVFNVKVTNYNYNPDTSTYTTQTYDPCLDLQQFTWVTNPPTCIGENCAGVLTICTKLPPNITTFSTPHDYISATATGASLFLDLRHGVGALDSTSFDSVITSPLVNDGLQPGYDISNAISVLSEMHQYNRSTAPCSTDILFDCALKCFTQYVSTTRGCWPLSDLSLAYKPMGMLPCMQHYEYAAGSSSPNASNQTRQIFQNCEINACLPPCVSRAYGSNAISIKTTWTPEFQDLAQVDLHQGSFSYVVFETDLIMDFQGFLWCFGGIIGLYIGGSIIALVHIPIFIISAIFRSLNSSRLNLRWFLIHGRPRHDVINEQELTQIPADNVSPFRSRVLTNEIYI